MTKTYTYYKCATWTDAKIGKMQYVTQLYKVGIYCAMYTAGERMPHQMNFQGKDIVKFINQLKKLEAEGIITDLVFDHETTISDATGFWEEIEQCNTKKKSTKKANPSTTSAALQKKSG